MYHGVLFTFLLTTIGLTLVLIFHPSFHQESYVVKGLFLMIALSLLLLMVITRVFALKAQDRAIRAEESLRYFILSGKPIPVDLTMSQIIALRFASDNELLELAEKTITMNLSSDQIKSMIQQWKPDLNRV